MLCGMLRNVRTLEGLGEEEGGGERGAQLVRERGEEVVLGMIGVLGVLVEADVVDGQRRPPGQLLARRALLVDVAAARGRGPGEEPNAELVPR